MSIEKFPIKEKLATDLDTQIAWLVREMGYSRDKTKGYEEKLTRLNRDPEEADSVFGFMSGYWHRFAQANSGLGELRNQTMANKSLQALAKVVAGLSDKVALANWLEKKEAGEQIDVEDLIDTALTDIKDRVIEKQSDYNPDELAEFLNSQTFDGNPMGQAVLNLHHTFTETPHDFSKLRQEALEGAVAGVLMWQHYAQGLSSDFSVEMPKPGLSSGNIEVW